MKMFMLKSFCLAALLLIAVLTGMQLANNGIQKMKGYDDPNLETAVSFQEKGKNLRASFLGNEISSHDIEAKKKKYTRNPNEQHFYQNASTGMDACWS